MRPNDRFCFFDVFSLRIFFSIYTINNIVTSIFQNEPWPVGTLRHDNRRRVGDDHRNDRFDDRSRCDRLGLAIGRDHFGCRWRVQSSQVTMADTKEIAVTSVPTLRTLIIIYNQIQDDSFDVPAQSSCRIVDVWSSTNNKFLNDSYLEEPQSLYIKNEH